MYKLYKMKRTFKDGRQDPANNKYFAKAVHLGMVTTDDLADVIQRNCSMKKSDVQAVLTELTEVMTQKLQESYVVKLDGLGIFKIGWRSGGADDEESFSVKEHIKGARVNFQPVYRVDITSGRRVKALVEGVKAKLRPEDPKPQAAPLAPGL